MAAVSDATAAAVAEMAYRDLTARYNERRDNLRKRKLRFKLRHLADGSAALVDGLFPFQKQVSPRQSSRQVDLTLTWGV